MKKIIIIGSLFLLFGLTNGVRIFFETIDSPLPENCPTKINIMLDTQGKDTLGTELIFGFNSNEIIIVGIEDGGLYEMPIGSKYFEKRFYFATTNLGQKYFNGYGKLGSLIIQSHRGIQTTKIEILSKSGKTVDSNIIDSHLKDILNQGVEGKYTFDKNLECTTKVSDFNIFQEPSFSGLDAQEAIKLLEKEIINAKNKSNNKSNIYTGIGVILLFFISIILALIIKKKKKHETN